MSRVRAFSSRKFFRFNGKLVVLTKPPRHIAGFPQNLDDMAYCTMDSRYWLRFTESDVTAAKGATGWFGDDICSLLIISMCKTCRVSDLI